uniref:Movement protein n=1 Tax=Fig badnavirus 1 TaxID=1034096 RepID=A0A1C8YYX8_9VIRU|nr:movement protein [Fig badnavirus 1]AOI28225.1 movement protein [Fig badnavirus 1]
MSSYIVSHGTNSYKEAIKATEEIESPAAGFVRPADFQGGTSAARVQIKQNNTLIQLLIQIAESLKDIREEQRVLKEEVRQLQKDKAASITEELVERLQSLSLGVPEKKVAEKKGTFRVFKDPLRILEEEKEKLPK